MADLTLDFGTEHTHSWRGARRRLDPIDRARLKDQLGSAIRRLSRLEEAPQAVADATGTAPAAHPSVASECYFQIKALAERPTNVEELIRIEAVVEDPAAVCALMTRIANHQDLKHALLEKVAPGALEVPWQEKRLEIAARGRSPFRFLSRRYRRAVMRLNGACLGAPPKTLKSCLELLAQLIEFRSSRETIRHQHSLGTAVGGALWKDEETSTDDVLPSLRWIVAQAERGVSTEVLRTQLAALPEIIDLPELAFSLKERSEDWDDAWRGITEMLDLDPESAFGASDVGLVSFRDIRARLTAWESDTEGLNEWHQFVEAARSVSNLDVGRIRDALADGSLRPSHAPQVLTFVRAEATWKRLCRTTPRLHGLNGKYRSANVGEFKRLDQQLRQLASQEVMLEHFRRIPQGSAGQVGIVRGESGKKTRHMPIRKLLELAGEAVQRIKPVFLMSPLSVAQYLPPGALAFDLLLIDEASQVRPEDAVGSIMRASKVLVVGDQKQLPPTSFFDRQLSAETNGDYSEELAEMQAAQVGDMESILSLCEARGMPGRMLKWHYRSHHPSLIAVSNREFYADKLVCPPSPLLPGGQKGLSLTFVGGEYLRGTKKTTPKEADAVVQEVLKHARSNPTETLGVVALSVSQRDEIRNKVEYMRTQNPELEEFCKEGKEEGFFVKNLENVQGDERDVIFISIGYGKNAASYMAQNFGPLSNTGGERRLNVLFTRAKHRCRVFASIRHNNIRLDALKHAAPRVLKRFLKYAELGELDIPLLTGGDLESPF